MQEKPGNSGGADLAPLVIVLSVMAAVVGLLIWVAQQQQDSRAASVAEYRAETERLRRENDEIEARLREAGVQVDPIEVE